MNRLIAIGERGTAFAELDAEQLTQVNVNGLNPIFKKTPRTREQLEKRDRNEHHGCLWADARSYVSTEKGQGEFWLGTIDRALQEQRIWKALVTWEEPTGPVQVSGYIRADYDGSIPHSKRHRIIAVDTKDGRVEALSVKRESGEGQRNSPVQRKVTKIVRWNS